MSTSEKGVIVELACSGNCYGTGMGFKVDHDRSCPPSGDAALLTRVRDTAKAKAYAKSQEDCTGDHCECHGDYQAIIPEQCITVKNALGDDVCLYFAYYAYLGECSILV